MFFEHISHLILVFLLLTLSRQMPCNESLNNIECPLNNPFINISKATNWGHISVNNQDFSCKRWSVLKRKHSSRATRRSWDQKERNHENLDCYAFSAALPYTWFPALEDHMSGYEVRSELNTHWQWWSHVQ